MPIGLAGDHVVTALLYLRDPDGNGVELYVDTSDVRTKRHWTPLSSSRGVDPCRSDQRNRAGVAAGPGGVLSGGENWTEIGANLALLQMSRKNIPAC